MNDDKRSVLMAELLGEVDVLFRRLEKFAPDLDAAHQRLAAAAASVHTDIASYHGQLTALKEQAQASAVNHIVRRTNEAAARFGRGLKPATRRGALGSAVGARFPDEAVGRSRVDASMLS